jgi:ActR/RegA family two-component response regulator
MIPALYKTEIQGLLNQLQPLSNFNNEASEIYMTGLGLITTVNAADEHESTMKPAEIESIIHELNRFEEDAEVFLKDVLHFNH